MRTSSFIRAKKKFSETASTLFLAAKAGIEASAGDKRPQLVSEGKYTLREAPDEPAFICAAYLVQDSSNVRETYFTHLFMTAVKGSMLKIRLTHPPWKTSAPVDIVTDAMKEVVIAIKGRLGCAFLKFN